MRFRPLVSILTPTYNQDQYVEKCIESVLSQTYANWEMLIVDDQSEDTTCQKVLRFRDERITLVHQTHVGISKLRETYARALREAKGELIALLDGDDWWPPNKLEIQVRAFEDRAIVMSFGAAELYDDQGQFLSEHKTPPSLLGRTPGRILVPMMLKRQYYPYSVTVMVRRSAVENLGGFVQPKYLPLVDIPTFLNLLRDDQWIFGFEEPLGFYRIHRNSVCRTCTLEIEEGHMRYAIEFLDANWEIMRLTERSYLAFRQELNSQHCHIRAVRQMQRGEWYQSFLNLMQATVHGDMIRKIKSLGRLTQLFVFVFIHYTTKGGPNK